MSAHCHHDTNFDGNSPAYRRALWAVVALNAVMFVVEMTAGALAGSQALQADALDFLADSLTYGLSLAVIGMPLARRSQVALLKGFSLLTMGLWVLGSTLWQVMGPGLPVAEMMGAVGFLALAANLASVLILMRYRDGDANVRSVWLCSRNDAIGNVAVIVAAVAVAVTASGWPDLMVAGLMSAMFLSSAWQILQRAWAEQNTAAQTPKVDARCGHDEGHSH